MFAVVYTMNEGTLPLLSGICKTKKEAEKLARSLLRNRWPIATVCELVPIKKDK